MNNKDCIEAVEYRAEDFKRRPKFSTPIKVIFITFSCVLIILLIVSIIINAILSTQIIKHQTTNLQEINLQMNKTGPKNNLCSMDWIVDNITSTTEPTTTNDVNYFKVINRTQWGAAPLNTLSKFTGLPIKLVIMAHSDTRQCHDFKSCQLQMNILRLYYIQLRNFEDIGYNFLIGGDGAVYEGVGWEYIGYHTKGHNGDSIGIGFIGNYEYTAPSENQLSAALLLLSYGMQNNYLDKDYILKGQSDLLSIVSPGKQIYERIKTWVHFWNRTSSIVNPPI